MHVALVLDAGLKSSLAAIRSLGRQGVPVVAGADRATAMGLHSRYVSGRFVYPSPLADRRGFLRSILAQARDAVILAFSDSTLLPLVTDGNLRAARGIYVLPPCPEHFEIAFDKSRTLMLAQKLGLQIPATHFCATGSECAALARTLTYPVVIKPGHSVCWVDNSGTHRTAAFAVSRADLERKYRSILAETGEAPLIQDYVRGEEAGVEFLCESGQVLAACAHRRIRSLAPTGGAGVVKQTVPLSYRGLGGRAALLASELHWSGPIMVEFKIDAATGTPLVMEINGRFWGSLPLAIAAGVDFPYLYYRLARGEHLSPDCDYRDGVITRHFMADLRNLMAVLFDRDPIRPVAFPGRLRALRDFLTPLKDCRPDVLDRNDLRPALAEIVDAAGRAGGSLWHRNGSGARH